MLQQLAKTPGSAQKRESAAERRRKGGEWLGPSEGAGLRKAMMRSERCAAGSGLHLVAACDAHNRQLVSRCRILKYSMYTMIQALKVRATAGRAAVRGVGQERPVFQISQNIAHPGRTENGTPGPMSVLPRQFNKVPTAA